MENQETMIPVIYEGVRLGLLVRHKDGIIPLVESEHDCYPSIAILAAARLGRYHHEGDS